jgi:hypothetical protein
MAHRHGQIQVFKAPFHLLAQMWTCGAYHSTAEWVSFLQVCRIANYLTSIGVKAGDDVTIYL